MRWHVINEYDLNKDIVDQLLRNRGIENIKDFLEPLSIKEYFAKTDNNFKNSLKKARNLIKKQISENKPILIYGDYDSDGINATAILYLTLTKELNYSKVHTFIPNRFDHGYGLSKDGIKEALSKIDNSEDLLIITVDTGITAWEEVCFLKEKGFNVIVTDHHQKPDKIPEADCIVWNDQMVGASVAWFLAKAMGSKDASLLSFASIATVTDMQELLGLNRAIVKKGLQILKVRPPIGIQALLETVGRSIKEISTYDLGWVIGPRLNASGRMVDPEDSLNLLVSQSKKEAQVLAQKLNKINSDRQDKTLEMYDIASDQDTKNLPHIIFSCDENYHEGIIGLVASKMVQKYNRPSVVVTYNDGLAKGSVRSIPEINIIELLREFKDMFESLGGHPMAAGFTMKKEDVSKLEEKMNKRAEEFVKEEWFVPSIDIDLKIPIDIIDLELVERLEKMKPFGLGNEKPVFMSEKVGITGVDRVGRDKNHLKLKLYKEGGFYKAIFFYGAEKFPDLQFGNKVDIAYSLQENFYNGKKYIDLVVKDIKII